MKIEKKDNILKVDIDLKRIEGQNQIFEQLLEMKPPVAQIQQIEFDLARVDYINSLGIAEFISIYRYFNDESKENFRFIFHNVAPEIAQIFEIVEIGQISEISSVK